MPHTKGPAGKRSRKESGYAAKATLQRSKNFLDNVLTKTALYFYFKLGSYFILLSQALSGTTTT